MTNRQSSWMTSSVPRPTMAFSSPSLGRLSDIKTRLSFSAVKTPAFKPKQRSLMDHARNSASAVNGYHMSKQNPDILDHLCSPSPSHRDHLLHKKTLTPSMVKVGGGGSVLNITRNGQSPGQSSLVKRMLNDKHRAPASLVHLATRGKSFRTSVTISPVIVKLSGAPPQSLPSSLNSSHEENGSPENGAEVNTRLSNGKGSSGKNTDPCDKNVVLSALRQRRKRWATSAPDDGHCSSTQDSPLAGAPSAKRTKHSSQGFESQNSPRYFVVGDRKRASTAPSYSLSPDLKKSRIGDGDGQFAVPPTLSKVAIPEIEFDRVSEVSELSEAERDSGTSSKASSRTPSECVGGIDSNELQRRSLTPPIQFDEAEMHRKREQSLNSLKAVFSPKGGDKKSNRRKLPIFCATGNKPHLPTPLSATHSVTQEDLKKDREAAAAKLREILTAEEDPLLPRLDSATSSSASLTTLSSSTNNLDSKGAPTNLSGAKLSSALSGSLPSLPSASAMTKTSLSSGVTSSLSQVMPKGTMPSVTVSAPTGALSFCLSSAGSVMASSTLTTATAVSDSQQTQMKSVSFAPLPVPTPASTTQAGFTFPLTTNSKATPGSQQPSLTLSVAPPSSASTTVVSIPAALPGSTVTNSLTAASNGVQLLVSSVPPTNTTTSATNSNSLILNVNNAAPQVGKALGLTLGTTFTQPPSNGFSIPDGGISQPGIFQNPSVAISTSSNLANTSATLAQGGGIFAAANSTAAAPTATSSGGFKFTLALPTTTPQQQPQSSGLMMTSTKPFSLTQSASSSASTSSIFSLNSGLQTTTSKLQPSSNGTGGITFGVPQQQQQPGQPSLFSGAQPQNGISFNFPQCTSSSGGSLPSTTSLSFTANTQQTQSTAGGGLNFNFSAGLPNNGQQNLLGGSGLNFASGNQSSGGLSLFKNIGNSQQQQQQQQPLSVLSASGLTNQPNGGHGGGLFGGQPQSQQIPQQTAATFTGFKLSAGTNTLQLAQGTQSSLLANTNPATANFASAGNAGGLNFTAGQSAVGGTTNGSSSMFNFSASTQQQPTQNQGGLFAFGQKPNPTGGINFNANGGGAGVGIGNQAQNGNSGFNFKAGTGMGLNSSGVKPASGLFNTNSSSNVFQAPLQQQSSSNVFQTPQTQKQPSFTATPTNQQCTPGPGGFNFQTTPSFNFSAGTPGNSTTSRPMARARRRKK